MHTAKTACEQTRTQVLVFRVGDEEFGVDIARVREIVKILGMVQVSDASDFVEGVIDVRGKVVLLIDLRKRLRVRARWTGEMRVVVFDFRGELVGLVVDAVRGVMSIDYRQVQQPSELLKAQLGFIRGFYKYNSSLMILVDIALLLSTEGVEGLLLEQTGMKSGC